MRLPEPISQPSLGSSRYGDSIPTCRTTVNEHNNPSMKGGTVKGDGGGGRCMSMAVQTILFVGALLWLMVNSLFLFSFLTIDSNTTEDASLKATHDDATVLTGANVPSANLLQVYEGSSPKRMHGRLGLLPDGSPAWHPAQPPPPVWRHWHPIVYAVSFYA
eukprot:GHVQ01001948.1.p2 GENE.GHVQ01001948.1~~GHVQ01001948.1.p2  ORF type:complete len:161 (+),score=28.22 GHVQ01001948.1:256-738(+)